MTDVERAGLIGFNPRRLQCCIGHEHLPTDLAVYAKILLCMRSIQQIIYNERHCCVHRSFHSYALLSGRSTSDISMTRLMAVHGSRYDYATATDLLWLSLSCRYCFKVARHMSTPWVLWGSSIHGENYVGAEHPSTSASVLHIFRWKWALLQMLILLQC